jgi:hypothetical protein
VLRSEAGIGGGIFGSEFGVTDGVFDGFQINNELIMSTLFSLEPRWYYNLKKRNSQSKDTNKNSGNFISLKTIYNPNLLIVSIDHDVDISQFSIITTWGLRRNIGNNFNIESGMGLGYLLSDNRGVLNLHLRIGYNF